MFCALVAAVLWGANLTAIYPCLQLLQNPEQTWLQHLDDSIDAFQSEHDQESLVLARCRMNLSEASDWPPGSARDTREHELGRAIAQLDGKLLRASRNIYWRQVLRRYLVGFLPTDHFRALLCVFGILIVAVAVRGVFEFWQESMVGSVTNLTLFDLRNTFFRSVIHHDVDQFSEQGAGELTARFTNDMESLGLGIKTLFGKVISEPLKAIVCVVCACWISWQLTLLFMILVPVAVVVLTRVGRMMKRASRRLLDLMSNIYKILQESFNGVRVVKSFTGEVYERKRFRTATLDFYKRAMRVVNIDAATSPIIELLGVVGISLAFMVGAYLVLQKETHLFSMRMTDYPMDISTLLQFYALLAAVADPVRKLSSVYTKLQTGAAAADRIFNSMDRRPRVSANALGEYLGRHAQSIEFRDVCFAYEPGRPTLANINLEVKHGETIALVGKNGCGKSTLVGMLPRFYDPDYGSIFVDGVELRRTRLRSLRRQVGLVTQDTVLFDDTVHANIAYGMPRARREQVVGAAKQAFAHDFIEKMSAGYETVIGDAGSKLSGGQRQRIALARAILRDPAILILDEFTSQCDAESEALIHQALRTFLRGRTSFVITHRLNTLEIADRIVVMDRGKICAVGTHAELLADCAAYQRLHEAHFQRRVA